MRKSIMLAMFVSGIIISGGANATPVCENFDPGWAAGSTITTVHLPHAVAVWNPSAPPPGQDTVKEINGELAVFSEQLEITVARITPVVQVSFRVYNYAGSIIYVTILDDTGKKLFATEVFGNSYEDIDVSGAIGKIEVINPDHEAAFDDFCVDTLLASQEQRLRGTLSCGYAAKRGLGGVFLSVPAFYDVGRPPPGCSSTQPQAKMSRLAWVGSLQQKQQAVHRQAAGDGEA